ncbi:DUF421 domain-containing protein [Mobilitalea sibirica]|uniref:DUF421 domain-containing protein n=1 Tax=Mobilitalea sibirica TaxID=1462919 RepID=A0A8J7GXD3_9FIRM|nr:DUF421 domain-containing protein [Mobilitalea sibirica]MBH1939804.1 DUF421 domain-containing protein [Mobilitalea sibirica]
MNEVIIKALYLTVIVYFLTLVLSRILGRKLVSQMTFFDYIVGIMIGSAAVQAATVQKNPSLSAFIILIVICLLTFIIDIIHLKSIRLRKLVDSEPIVVIEKGKIVDKNMKKIQLSLDELNMMLREKNYFNHADVESAILEANGKLSVQAKAEKQPLTPSDIYLTPAYKGLTRDVIIDGKVMENNLKYINKDEHWLKKQLVSYGVHDFKDVFYAGMDTSGNFYVSKKQNNKEVPGMHGIE